ncbi:MAG: FAD binding domain-containing protein [Carbonactinosporaceae bacterium]
MKPPPFDYRRPDSLAETLDVLGSLGDAAKVLAGGQSLVPMMNLRLAYPEALVDINHVVGLNNVHFDDEHLRIGAAVRDSTVERCGRVAEANPLLARAIQFVGHPPIRNRGTLCGSLAHADPAAELPAVALATGARMKVASKRGVREVPADDFFRSYFTTILEPDELLVEAVFPTLAAGSGWGFQEVSRRYGDFAMVGVAAVVAVQDGACRDARLSIFGGGAVPTRVRGAEQLLEGRPLSPDLFEEAGRSASESLAPQGDVHASASYRKEIAGVLVARALGEAYGRAGRNRA